MLYGTQAGNAAYEQHQEADGGSLLYGNQPQAAPPQQQQQWSQPQQQQYAPQQEQQAPGFDVNALQYNYNALREYNRQLEDAVEQFRPLADHLSRNPQHEQLIMGIISGQLRANPDGSVVPNTPQQQGQPQPQQVRQQGQRVQLPPEVVHEIRTLRQEQANVSNTLATIQLGEVLRQKSVQYPDFNADNVLFYATTRGITDLDAAYWALKGEVMGKGTVDPFPGGQWRGIVNQQTGRPMPPPQIPQSWPLARQQGYQQQHQQQQYRPQQGYQQQYQPQQQQYGPPPQATGMLSSVRVEPPSARQAWQQGPPPAAPTPAQGGFTGRRIPDVAAASEQFYDNLVRQVPRG